MYPERFSHLPEYAFPRFRALLDGHDFSVLVLGKFPLVNGAIKQNKKVGKQSFNKETFSSLSKS